jgi:acetolactate synthase-1/2/3 large subunit
MGSGFPAAIGAALEKRDATVACFSGDGSLLMNIQELITAVEQDVNVKIILCNNNSLGLVHQQQDLFYKKRIFASRYHQSVDFAAIARGFKMEAHDLGNCMDPSVILAEALAKPGPVLINVPIDVQQHVFPMVPPGGANKEMFTHMKSKGEE